MKLPAPTEVVSLWYKILPSSMDYLGFVIIWQDKEGRTHHAIHGKKIGYSIIREAEAAGVFDEVKMRKENSADDLNFKAFLEEKEIAIAVDD